MLTTCELHYYCYSSFLKIDVKISRAKFKTHILYTLLSLHNSLKYSHKTIESTIPLFIDITRLPITSDNYQLNPIPSFHFYSISPLCVFLNGANFSESRCLKPTHTRTHTRRPDSPRRPLISQLSIKVFALSPRFSIIPLLTPSADFSIFFCLFIHAYTGLHQRHKEYSLFTTRIYFIYFTFFHVYFPF